MQRPGGLPRPSLRPHPTIVTMRNVPSSAGWDRPSDIGVPRNGPATRVVPLVVLLVAAFIAAGAFAGCHWSQANPSSPVELQPLGSKFDTRCKSSTTNCRAVRSGTGMEARPDVCLATTELGTRPPNSSDSIFTPGTVGQ